jgi:hypothetical protein
METWWSWEQRCSTLKTPEKFPEGKARAGYLEETSELHRVELPMDFFLCMHYHFYSLSASRDSSH